MPLPFGFRWRKLFSILSLTTGSNERWNRKVKRMIKLHSAKISPVILNHINIFSQCACWLALTGKAQEWLITLHVSGPETALELKVSSVNLCYKSKCLLENWAVVVRSHHDRMDVLIRERERENVPWKVTTLWWYFWHHLLLFGCVGNWRIACAPQSMQTCAGSRC